MSNNEKQTVSNGGISFCSLLFIVFLVLKLTHIIDWSWWWVTAPLWGGFALCIVIVGLFLLFSLIMQLIDN